MGCESSQADVIELPKKQQSVPITAANLITQSKFSEAEKIGDELFHHDQITQAILVYQKIIEANYFHDYEIEGIGNYEIAVGQYESCIYTWYQQSRQKGKFKGNPYDALSLCYCQIISKHENVLREGIAWYEQMLGNVQSYQLYSGYANILSNSKKYKEAIKAYNKVITLKPTLVNSYISIAFIHQYRKNDKNSSLQMAKKILGLYPQNMYALLITAINEGDEASKLQSLKQISQKFPSYAKIIYEIGHIFDQKKDHKQAISWYKKCIQAVPSYATCYYRIGNDLQSTKNYGQALNWYMKACELDCCYQAPHLRVCNIFKQLGYTDIRVEEEVKKYPKMDLYYFYYYLGVSQYDKPNIDNAIKWFKKAQEIQPDSYRLLNYLGMSFDQKEDYKNGQKYYLMCIQKHPKYPNAYYNLAILYKHKKNDEKAASWFKKAVEVNPRYKYASSSASVPGQKKLRILNPIKPKSGPLSFLTNLLNLKAAPTLAESQHQVVIADKKAVDEEVEENEIDEQQNQLFLNIFKMFESRAYARSQNAAFKHELLQIVRQIFKDRFQLKNIGYIYELVKKLVHDDEEYFHIIPQLFILYFERNLFIKKTSAAQIQKNVKQAINDLLVKQSNGNISPMKIQQASIQLKHFTPPSDPKVNLLKNPQKIVMYQALCSQIAQINETAEKTLAEFIDLVEDVRKRSNGIEFIAMMKIPNYQKKSFRYLFPIIQHIFKGDINQAKSSAISSQIWEEITKLGEKASTKQVANKIQSIWGKEISKILSDRAKQKNPPQLNLLDLIKGKVTFNSIEDLSRGLEVTDNICFLRGYEIIGLTNRLTNRDTRDVVLTIKIHDIICQFQLTLKHNEDRHHLKELLHEIDGTLGSAIGSYIFMGQTIAYPLLSICQSIESEFSVSEKEQEKSTAQAARFVIASLQKSKPA